MVAGIVAKMAVQEELDRGMQIDAKALVEVEWLDACAHMNIEKIDLKNLLSLLSITKTFGRVVARDKEVLCIASNISAVNGADIIAIPVRWIQCIKILETE